MRLEKSVYVTINAKELFDLIPNEVFEQVKDNLADKVSNKVQGIVTNVDFGDSEPDAIFFNIDYQDECVPMKQCPNNSCSDHNKCNGN